MAKMSLTRIVVAHRAETIAQARRVLLLDDGRLRERPPASGRELEDPNVRREGA